jgi:predicted phosphodiesterase
MVQLAVAAALTALATASCGEATAARPSATVRDAVIDGIAAGTLMLPNAPASVKFAVIGDSGRGNTAQREVADQMARYHDQFKFPFTIMLGDNLYEGEATPEDYRVKFEEPYKALLDRGVRFYAALGNHDDPRQVLYEGFHMMGRRYYSFTPPGNVVALVTTPVEFFAVDSTYLDRKQLTWLDNRLEASAAEWKICFLHHPLYTSGRYHLASLVQRASLEPLFVARDVSVVFSGHEHIYQRSTLQGGIQYFVSGGAGSLRRSDGVPTSYIARTYAGDYHFMLVEIVDDELHFQAISRTGHTIDAGTVSRSGRRPSPSRITALGTAGRR